MTDPIGIPDAVLIRPTPATVLQAAVARQAAATFFGTTMRQASITISRISFTKGPASAPFTPLASSDVRKRRAASASNSDVRHPRTTASHASTILIRMTFLGCRAWATLCHRARSSKRGRRSSARQESRTAPVHGYSTTQATACGSIATHSSLLLPIHKGATAAGTGGTFR